MGVAGLPKLKTDRKVATVQKLCVRDAPDDARAWSDMRSALRTRFVFWSLNSEAPHPCTLQYPKRHTSRPLTGRTLREGQRAEERRCSAHSWSPSRPLILKRRGTKEQTPTVGCGASRSRGLVADASRELMPAGGLPRAAAVAIIAWWPS